MRYSVLPTEGLGASSQKRCRKPPAAGLGVSPNSILPPRLGVRGLNQARAVTVQPEAAGSLRVSLRSLLYFPQEWGIKGAENEFNNSDGWG